MAAERRRVPRAVVPGMRVVFEDAAGQRVDADVIDVGSGGVFIRTAAPLAVGKRISLQVGAVAGVAEWSALGRVVWTRETGAAGAPPGMGVTLIDVDDAVVAAVDRLVASRSHAPSAAKFADEAPTAPAAPSVPAILAASAAPESGPISRSAPASRGGPDVHGMPTREVVVPRMVLALATRPDTAAASAASSSAASVASASASAGAMRARERSLVVDLVAKKAPANG
ncbi:MAG TPA: PilZ domain-containing protein, partial [Polyangiaceae bacterium]